MNKIFEAIEALKYTDKGNFLLIAGPSVVEDEDMVFDIAEHINEVTDSLQIPFIFKASYRKSNRSSKEGFTGIGDEAALRALSMAGEDIDAPVLTDIHNPDEAIMASTFVDVIQVPSFLSRQTDLLVAAAKTGNVVNIKKGPFMSPEALRHAVDKVKNAGNDKVVVTERGSMFGYDDVVVDYRNIPIMKSYGVPVLVDCTQPVRCVKGLSDTDEDRMRFIETIARAAIAAGADGLYMETHPNPLEAKVDNRNMLRLDMMKSLLERLLKIHQTVRSL